MKLIHFFLILFVNFVLLDPDPDSESGSTNPIESGSNMDPDPQLCFPDPTLATNPKDLTNLVLSVACCISDLFSSQ
jgi:hypothetical protein